MRSLPCSPVPDMPSLPCLLCLFLLFTDNSRASIYSTAATLRLSDTSKYQKIPDRRPQGMAAFLMLILLISYMSTGTSSPQSLKKILSLSEEGNERHRRQLEDTMSNASSQLSSPPTSPQSSPKKGKPIILPPSHSILLAASHRLDVSQMPSSGRQLALHYISVICRVAGQTQELQPVCCEVHTKDCSVIFVAVMLVCFVHNNEM